MSTAFTTSPVQPTTPPRIAPKNRTQDARLCAPVRAGLRARPIFPRYGRDFLTTSSGQKHDSITHFRQRKMIGALTFYSRPIQARRYIIDRWRKVDMPSIISADE